jgi:hypothetical protein
MSAGSFCPSPSRVTIHGARARETPVHSDALWPEDAWCLTDRSRGKFRTASRSRAGVSSTLPSSTTTTS